MFSQESEATDSDESDSGHLQDLDQQNRLLLQQQLALANSKLLYSEGGKQIPLPFEAKSMEAFTTLLMANCRWAIKTSSEKELDQACCIEGLLMMVNFELARGFKKTAAIDDRCFNMTYNTNDSPKLTLQNLHNVFEG